MPEMMGRRGIVTAFAIAGLLALVAGVLWRQADRDDSRTLTTSADGAALLAVSLPDAAGKVQPLAQWKGKVVVLNFWATWCEPCREEMPRFVKLQDELGAQGLQFVGIAIDQADRVQQFAAEIALNYPTLIGSYGSIELSKVFGNRLGALPFTIIMDRSGQVVYTQLGPVKDQQLQAKIRQLL
jgi:thiol-disulfide isomerase/thioredoxin